jgi:predicted nuclease with TOPRIM domain
MNEDLTNTLSLQSSQIAQLLSLAQETKSQLNGVDQRLTALEQKVEARLYDTRPIWERVSGEIDRLRIGQEELRAGQEELRAGQQELRAGQEELRAKVEGLHSELTSFRIETNQNLKLIEKKFRHVFGEIGELRGEIDLLEERVDKLAPQTEA